MDNLSPGTETRTGVRLTKMVDCEPCRGNGRVQGICGTRHCGTCYGAGEVEVWVEDNELAECDCCGKTFHADQLVTIPADRAGAAQCDTTACDECRGVVP